MNTAVASEVLTLSINHTYDAPRDVVFDAWGNAEALTQWFAPDPSMKTIVDELDVKEGGRYRIQMVEADGAVNLLTGEYINIDRPEQLVFTWQWLHGDDKSIMLVTLDFIDKGETTELQLTHEKLPNAESRDLHDMGWQGCLNRLGEHITAT